MALFGHRIGVHIHQLTGDQQFFASKNRTSKGHGRVADAVAAHTDLEKIVHLGTGVVLDAGLFDIQVSAQLVHGFGIRHGQLPPVIGHSGVKVHQVVTVEDDLLHVHFDPTHAHAMRKTEVLAFHGFNFQKRVVAPGPHRHALSVRREWRVPW